MSANDGASASGDAGSSNEGGRGALNNSATDEDDEVLVECVIRAPEDVDPVDLTAMRLRARDFVGGRRGPPDLESPHTVVQILSRSEAESRPDVAAPSTEGGSLNALEIIGWARGVVQGDAESPATAETRRRLERDQKIQGKRLQKRAPLRQSPVRAPSSPRPSTSRAPDQVRVASPPRPLASPRPLSPRRQVPPTETVSPCHSHSSTSRYPGRAPSPHWARREPAQQLRHASPRRSKSTRDLSPSHREQHVPRRHSPVSPRRHYPPSHERDDHRRQSPRSPRRHHSSSRERDDHHHRSPRSPCRHHSSSRDHHSRHHSSSRDHHSRRHRSPMSPRRPNPEMEAQLPFFFRQCISSADDHVNTSQDLFSYVGHATKASAIKSRLRDGGKLPGQADRSRYNYSRRQHGAPRDRQVQAPPRRHEEAPLAIAAINVGPVAPVSSAPIPPPAGQPIPVIPTNPLLIWRDGPIQACASSASIASGASFRSVASVAVSGIAAHPTEIQGDIGVFDALAVYSEDEEEEREEEEEAGSQEPAPPGDY